MKVENRASTSSHKSVEDQGDNRRLFRNAGSKSKVGEIELDDLYEPMNPEKLRECAQTKSSHFQDVCAQMLADHENHPKTRVALQVVARVLGLTVARCLSNVIAYFSGRAWLEARRDYAVLPKETKIINAQGEALKIDGSEATVQQLAERFKPRLYTISEDQSIDENMAVVEMRYEVLPPRRGKNCYSIIYYVRREREHMPVFLLGTILDWLRPLFWATKSEWNAIEIDIDRESGEPVSLNYESCNYTGDPLSFEITSGNDLHLPVKAVLRDKKWVHTLYQKDNRAKARDIENPFDQDSHPGFTFVNWNGGLDLSSAAKLNGYQADTEATNKSRLFKLADLPLKFLDIDTYRKEALDLRNQWLKRRQTGQSVLFFPPRKQNSEFKVINLVSTQLPSLFAPPSL